MDNTTLYGRVQYLQQKITQLLSDYRKQQALIQQLKMQNEQLMQQVASKVEMAHDFLGGLAMHKITEGSDWEARLTGYINDIDKSIAYLENMQ